MLIVSAMTATFMLHRAEGGALKYAEHAHNEEMGGIESMIDLDPGFAEDEEYEVLSNTKFWASSTCAHSCSHDQLSASCIEALLHATVNSFITYCTAARISSALSTVRSARCPPCWTKSVTLMCTLLQSDDEQLDNGHAALGHPGADADTEKKGLLGPKLEADYDFFVDVMWAKISTKEEKQIMTPALVYQVHVYKHALHPCVQRLSLCPYCLLGTVVVQPC